MTIAQCCDQRVQVASMQSFTLWQQATIKIICCNHFIIASSCHINLGIIFSIHLNHGALHMRCCSDCEVATRSPPFYNVLHCSHVRFVKVASDIIIIPSINNRFVPIGEHSCHMCKASICDSKQQQRSHAVITLLLLVHTTHF